MFITFEGVEGCGKSTIAQIVHKRLLNLGYPVLLTREPGGVKISEKIRKIILDKENTNLDHRCEALLFAASRRQHLVEKVRPALKEGKIVLCDRYIDSSLAYQGGGEGVGVDEVLRINLFAIENTFPDITFLLDIDPQLGLQRINDSKNREVNRLDLESIKFYDTVRKTFLELSEKYKERYIVIDASKSIDVIAEEVLDKILQKLQ